MPFFLRRGRTDRSTADAAMGTRMWIAERRHWESIVDLCRAHRVPLVFQVLDIDATEATSVLTRHIQDLCMKGKDTFVQVLGPDLFELDVADRLEFRRLFNERFTLVRDPHANEDQHRTIGLATASFLRSLNLLVCR